jgi:hypothetical protein
MRRALRREGSYAKRMPLESRPVTARRIDTVTIDLDRGPVTIPWASRAPLLAEFRKLEGMRRAVAEFENAGTSRPVVRVLV